MFHEGKIKSYNTERGFGFIQRDQEKDIFFHITDVPSRHIEPKVGENVKYLIVEENGKFKADNIVRLDLKQNVMLPNQSKNNPITVSKSQLNKTNLTGNSSKIFTIIGLIVIVILSFMLYEKYQQYQEQKKQRLQELMQKNENIVKGQRKALGDFQSEGLSEQGRKNLYGDSATNTSNNTDMREPVQKQVISQFKCDGRQHCTQMRSYDEAIFFLRNCPDTKMDGDRDGIPCEQQFGRH